MEKKGTREQQLVREVFCSGGFRTTKPSLHATTNAAMIQRFVPVAIRFEQESELVWQVEVS
jgi:RNA 3'-terminal phosphate cyclase